MLLHSGGMSGRQWKRLVERLSRTHRVVAPDLLGSGENPPWPADAPFHFSQDVEAIAALVRGLGQPVHLVGHSYGGLLALMVARDSPALVRSIAAYDPVAFGILQDEPDAETLMTDTPALVDDAIGGSEAWFRIFVDWWNGDGTWASLPEPARASFLRVGRKVFFEVKSLLGDRTSAAQWGTIRAPTILFTGERTPSTERRVVHRLGAAMPGARIVEVPGAGHMGAITHADLVDPEIARHIAES